MDVLLHRAMSFSMFGSAQYLLTFSRAYWAGGCGTLTLFLVLCMPTSPSKPIGSIGKCIGNIRYGIVAWRWVFVPMIYAYWG